MKRPLLLLLFSVISLVLPGQKLRFVCQGCKVTKEEKRDILVMARHEVDFYRTIFQVKTIPVISVRIYGNHKTFMASQHSSPRYGRSESGYYDHKRKEVCVYRDSNFVHTCFHEVSHAIIATQCEHFPVWLNEGLAEYFEFSRVDTSGHVTTYAPKTYLEWMKRFVASPGFHAHRVVRFSYRRFHKHFEGNHYLFSWSIVYFLAQTNREALRNIVIAVSQGAKSTTAIEDYYKGGLQQLDSDIVQFYK